MSCKEICDSCYGAGGTGIKKEDCQQLEVDLKSLVDDSGQDLWQERWE